MIVMIVSLPGCFVDLPDPRLDQSEPRAGLLPDGPQEPEHPGSEPGPLFGRAAGEAASAVAGAVQL